MTTDNHVKARAELERAAKQAVRDICLDSKPDAHLDIIAAAETYHAALLAANPPELEWYPHDNCLTSLKTDHWIEVEGRSPRVFQPWFEKGKIGPPFNTLRQATRLCEEHAASRKDPR